MPRIDVHHHLAAPRALSILVGAGILTARNAEAMIASRALEDMGRAGVTAAVDSTPPPPHAMLEDRTRGVVPFLIYRELAAAGVLSAAEMTGIEYRNVAQLLPRFGGSL